MLSDKSKHPLETYSNHRKMGCTPPQPDPLPDVEDTQNPTRTDVRRPVSSGRYCCEIPLSLFIFSEYGSGTHIPLNRTLIPFTGAPLRTICSPVLRWPR